MTKAPGAFVLAAAFAALFGSWRPAFGADDAPSNARTEDVVYGRRDGTALTMDVFRPTRPNGVAIVQVMMNLGSYFILR